MKVIKFTKTRQFEGLDEIKLSLLIHLALLLALSAFFVWRQASAQPVKKPVVPVKLISPVAKPRVGSGAKPAKTTGSKTAAGKTSKVVKKTSKKPVRKVVSKKTVKPAAKPVKKEQTVVTPKVETKSEIAPAVNTPIKTETVSTKPVPAAIQEPVKETLPIKPVHNSPTFENVGYLAPGESTTSEIDPELAGLEMSSPMDELMPDSFLEEEKQIAMPDEFVPAPTGIESSENKDASGLFEIGSIESFGGNGESFTAPGIVSKVLPEYPDWARKNGAHGSAVYRVLIQQSGTVGDVVTMSSTIDPKLAINGAQALRRWVFTPVLRNGEPQETWVKITVQYQLN
jgi:TonB family protein